MKVEAKRLMGGRGQGPVLVCTEPISFLGGVGPTTGEIIDPHSPIAGQNVSGRVLAFPRGKGSTVGSYVLYALARRGRAPAAIVVAKADTIVTVGAVIGGIPAIYGLPPDTLVDGEWAEVDGDKGTIRVRDVEAHDVVTCFLRNRGELLLLKRSGRVGTFKGRWAGVSGYMEGNEVPLERALTEIREEVGGQECHLYSSGEPVYARDGPHMFIVHPFLFDVDRRKVHLDWEHVDYRWIAPSQIAKYDTVPKLAEAYESAVNGRLARGVKAKRGGSA